MNNWEVTIFNAMCCSMRKTSFLQAAPKIKTVLYQKASGDGKAIRPEGILFPMEKWHSILNLGMERTRAAKSFGMDVLEL